MIEVKDITERSYLEYKGIDFVEKKHVNTATKSGVKFYWFYYKDTPLVRHFRDTYRRGGDEASAALKFRDALKD